MKPSSNEKTDIFQLLNSEQWNTDTNLDELHCDTPVEGKYNIFQLKCLYSKIKQLLAALF